jgi:hypothetical protein
LHIVTLLLDLGHHRGKCGQPCSVNVTHKNGTGVPYLSFIFPGSVYHGIEIAKLRIVVFNHAGTMRPSLHYLAPLKGCVHYMTTIPVILLVGFLGPLRGTADVFNHIGTNGLGFEFLFLSSVGMHVLSVRTRSSTKSSSSFERLLHYQYNSAA